MDAIKTIEHEGYKIELYPDEDPESPRDWDHPGKMVCFHNRYTLGDRHNLNHKDFSGWDAMESHISEELGGVVILPLFLYDHGGITMSTGPFGCRWDSGQVGFIYITKDEVLSAFQVKTLTKDVLARATELLESEVKVYDQYLRGDVYGYKVLDKDGEEVDSCWGYFGDDAAIEAAKEHIAYLLKQKSKEKV